MSAGSHIFLCGFMGSGKSTYGKKLAALLKRPFIDLDQYIQQQENKTISFIFENEGEEQFRRLETEHLQQLVQEKDFKVISLGGGTVCFNNNIEIVKKHGLLIYIEMPAAALAQRLNKSGQKRPLLKNISAGQLPGFIQDMLDKRDPFYRQAHITINGLNLNHLQLHRMIIDHLEKNNQH